MRYSSMPQQEEILLRRGVKGKITKAGEKRSGYNFFYIDVELSKAEAEAMKKKFTKDSLVEDADTIEESEDLDFPERPYVNWCGEHLYFGMLAAVANGDHPITFEDLKKSYIWKDIDEAEKVRVAKYWECANKYWEIA